MPLKSKTQKQVTKNIDILNSCCGAPRPATHDNVIVRNIHNGRLPVTWMASYIYQFDVGRMHSYKGESALY